MNKTKILVLGASGMLGHKVFEVLSSHKQYDVYGSVTSFKSFSDNLPLRFKNKIYTGIYANDLKTIDDLLKKLKPTVIINCIGIIKHKENASDGRIVSITLNALFPHQLAALAEKNNARVITIATDCVFDGQKGSAYALDDKPTCHDVYGMTKYLGEINYGDHLTLRTSIIGHELNSQVSLLDWFLSNKDQELKGFKKAIFSGLPTVELAKIIAEKIIPNKDINGLKQISVNPISKYELLKLVATEYHKQVKFIPVDQPSINRALESTSFKKKINYITPSWTELIKKMHTDFLTSEFYQQKRKQYDF